MELLHVGLPPEAYQEQYDTPPSPSVTTAALNHTTAMAMEMATIMVAMTMKCYADLGVLKEHGS